MEHTVSIFTTPSCAYCKMAKEYFTKNNVAYNEYDVAKDIVRRQEMLDKTHQFGVPVIEIDGKIFCEDCYSEYQSDQLHSSITR